MDDWMEKYADYSVVLLESLNAKRTFGFDMASERNMRKMLFREDVRLVVLSPRTFNRFMGIHGCHNFVFSRFLPGNVMVAMFFNSTCLVNSDMDDGVLLLVCNDNSHVFVKLSPCELTNRKCGVY